ncbi:translation elongation factor Ts [Treponema zuelzerae]|uniref:Elongation factor Ts n=1 Tax=Teretinema zuelzerae TaxID=156 RepID=A0AAE3JL81_9SPIR|nr:translation elongation factor Ts [Teretinema zuelzerae]MBN2812014.1 elongation factor Ts [Spirochaetales bacterium]MCD1654569.1 translation elongation factor Ts [Teretinema zuelzerae]
MEIKASDVKALRDKTSAGMMECKNALAACNGDAAAAEKLLKEKGLAAVEKRAGRATSEGLILIKTDGKKAVMAELTCETDFVAKNEDFVALGDNVITTAFAKNATEVTPDLSAMVLDMATKVRENMALNRLVSLSAGADEYIAKYIHSDKKTGVLIMMKSDKAGVFENASVQEFAYDCCLHVAAFTPMYTTSAEVDPKYIEEQTEIFKAQAKESGKPENVQAGIVQGKLKKHLAEICFLDQPFVKDDKLSVSKKMDEVGASVGAKITLSKMVLFQLGVN